MVYLGIALCFLPLIISFVLFASIFKIKVTHELIAILLGLAAVFPISVIQYFLPEVPILRTMPILKSLLKSLFIYGLVEEIIKMVLVLPLPHKNYSILHFLLLSFLMGLAVGCFESLVYFLDKLQIANSRGASLLYGQIFVRIISSDLIHMTCTGLGALFITSCRNKPKNFLILLAAISIHGFYDFFAGFHNGLKWFSIPVILLGIVECRIKYSSVQNLCEDRLTIFY